MKRIKRQARFAATLSCALAAAACTPLGGAPPQAVGEGEGEGEFTPSPAADALVLPFDAAPSPDGETIFFTARGADGASHSLWRVPADASAPAVELASGFVLPISVALSADGATVYVADAGHDTSDPAIDDDASFGALFTVPAQGGAKLEVPGTYGLRVRGIEAWGASMLLSGKDPADGEAGIFELDDAGALSALAKGAPFSDPSGIAAEIDGDAIYVVDTTGAEDGSGVVLKLADGAVTRLTASLEVGMPAGAALSLDEGALFVSGLVHGETGRQAAVHVVDVKTGAHVTTTDGLEGNDEAGGLHRARDTGTFAWAGARTVYRITFE